MNISIFKNITPGDFLLANTTQLMSDQGYVAAVVILFLIGLFGFFFNLFVIILMFKQKELWTPMNVILFNLICSDFSVSIFGNPFTLVSAMNKAWIFGRTMCVIYGFFMSLLGITSITTLMVLAFERYVMVARPLQSHHLTKYKAKIIVLLIWVYSFILTGPPLFGWGNYVNESANISCSVNWEHKNISTTTYICFLFVFGLIIPIIVICFSYINIVLTLKQKTLEKSNVSKAETRITVMVAVMIIAFLIAWTPYATFALVIAFGNSKAFSAGMGVIPALLAKSSIFYNPIIYVGLNTQFQLAWKRAFRLNIIKMDTQGLEYPSNTKHTVLTTAV